MDYLRSAYETDCFFAEGQTTPSRIRWYFVDQATPSLPFPTIFTSNEWLDEPEGDQALGEVPGAPRTWVDGTPPFPVAGGTPCGTANDFAGGAPWPFPGATVNVFGGLACCQLPPRPFVFFTCQFCPDGAFSDYTLSAQGATGPFVNGNGLWRLRYIGNCTWESQPWLLLSPPNPDFVTWQINIPGAPGFRITLARPATAFGWFYPLTGWDCLSPRLAPASGPPNTPPPGAWLRVQLFAGASSANGLFCTQIGAATHTGYVLFMPVNPAAGRNPHVPSGYYPVVNDRPCSWSGTVPTVARGSVEGFPLQVRVTIFADRHIQAVFTAAFFGSGPPVSFSSVAGWDGISPIALVRDPGSVSFLVWPNAIQLTWPGDT